MTIDFDPWLSLEIEGTYHSIAKCQQLAHIAAIAATDVSNLFIASKGFTTFTENGRIYDLASFSDSYEEPLPMQAWLVSYMLKNNLYEEVLTSEDSRRVLKEKYDIGFGEPYRPTNYIDSSDEEAYMNVEFDEMSILAIEDKLILLIGVIAHNLGLDHECVRDHFNGDSGKQHYFKCNRELFMTIAGKQCHMPNTSQNVHLAHKNHFIGLDSRPAASRFLWKREAFLVKSLMFFGLAEPDSKQIHRAHHDGRTTLENMRIDHGGLHIAMTKELLNGSDLGTALQQVGGASMAKALAMAKTTYLLALAAGVF